MTYQATVAFPVYELETYSTNGSNASAHISISITTQDGPFPGGITEDQAVQYLHAYLSSLPNVNIYDLKRFDTVQTVL